MREKVLDFIVIVAGLVGIVLLIFVLLPFVRKSQTANNSKQESKKAVTLTGLEIAKRIATYLDNAMLPNGDFIFSNVCEKEDKQCRPVKTPDGQPHSNEQVILAYYELYKKTGDQKYKNKADRAMNFILLECQKNTQYCFENVSAIHEYWIDTKDEKYKNAIIKSSGLISDNRDFNVTMVSKIIPKLAVFHDVTGEEKYKTLLVNEAETLLKELTKIKQSELPTRPVFGLATIDYLSAFKATDNQKYIESSTQIMDRFESQQALEQLKDPKYNDLYSTLGISFFDLSNFVKRQKQTEYLKMAHVLAQELVTNSTDFPERIRFIGDNSFFVKSLNAKQTAKKDVVYSKQSRLNGRLVQLFLKMSDKKFMLNS